MAAGEGGGASLHDPRAYLRANLVHPRIEELSDGTGILYATQNVVSNMMLDPERIDEEGYSHPQNIPLMELLNASHPHVEYKQSFGAAILRYTTPLQEEQKALPEVKHDCSTHLCFGTGALGSTGNKSVEEAIHANHMFRLDLEAKLGIKTSFRRYSNPNTVCTTSLGYPINLARMHAAAPLSRPYFPDVFPGLFFFYTHTYEDRTALYEKVKGSRLPAKRRLCLVEGDLEQYQNALHHGPVSADARAAAISSASTRDIAGRRADDPVVQEVQAAFQSYLPPKEDIAVLVFGGGNIVGLVFNNPEIGQKAFRHVMEVAKEFRLTDEEAAEFYAQQKNSSKKKKSQTRLKAKTEVLDESFNINYRKVISDEGIRRIEEIVSTVPDVARRQTLIRAVMVEEEEKKRRRKGKNKGKGGGGGGGADDADDDHEALLRAIHNDVAAMDTSGSTAAAAAAAASAAGSSALLLGGGGSVLGAADSKDAVDLDNLCDEIDALLDKAVDEEDQPTAPPEEHPRPVIDVAGMLLSGL